jgi:hypothetical protein
MQSVEDGLPQLRTRRTWTFAPSRYAKRIVASNQERIARGLPWPTALGRPPASHLLHRKNRPCHRQVTRDLCQRAIENAHAVAHVWMSQRRRAAGSDATMISTAQLRQGLAGPRAPGGRDDVRGQLRAHPMFLFDSN